MYGPLSKWLFKYTDLLVYCESVWLKWELLLCFDDGCVSPLCCLSNKKEKESEDVAEPVLDDEDPAFQDDPNDLSYQPQSPRYTYLKCIHLTPSRKWGNPFQVICCFTFSGAEEEESLSSDEDVPFRDDLNDQSYDPKVERCVRVCVWHD